MSKLPHVGTTIFSVMSKLALEHQAINLAQGFPNFPVDEALLKIYQEKLKQDVHQYAPMPGNTQLLNEISKMIDQSYGRKLNPNDEVLVTAGATEAIYAAIQAFVGAGDEVVVLDPAYDCYDPSIVLAGGKAIHVPLKNDFSVDWDLLRKHLHENSKMLIINNPHNPSGQILFEKDLEALHQLMKDFPKLILLSDEVYEFITFEKKHLSVNLYPSLLDRSIIVSSFGKTFHITGWKMGYLVAPETLMREIKKVHQFLVFSVNSVAQSVLSEYLPTVDPTQLSAYYQEKRDLFRSLLASSKFKLLPCEGSYFQVVDYSGLSDMPDVEFVRELTITYGVAAIPLSVFHEDGKDLKLIRFCFAKDDETLIKACEKLCKIH